MLMSEIILTCYFFLADQDKENDSRNAQATQAVIQRRRRPKRRSTGVVHVDIDVSSLLVCKFLVAPAFLLYSKFTLFILQEIDPDRQESGAEASKNSEEVSGLDAFLKKSDKKDDLSKN